MLRLKCNKKIYVKKSLKPQSKWSLASGAHFISHHNRSLKSLYEKKEEKEDE